MDAVTIAGVRLEVQRIGALRAGAPALVFLHEALGSVSQWRDFPARLADAVDLPALVYSRQGHGRSAPMSRPRDLNYLQDEAPVLGELLAHEGLDRPVLFGHSDGAAIALAYAARAHVDALVLEAPHVFVDREPQGVAEVASTYAASGLREKLLRHHGANTDALFAAWADTWTAPWFTAWTIEPLLPRITAPMFLVQGLDDPYTRLVQTERIEAGVRGPHPRLVLAHCGHAPHRDRPDEVIARTREFLARHLAR